MKKKIITFLSLIFAFYLAGSGIYFYRKSFLREPEVEIPKTFEKFDPSELTVFKELMFDFEDPNTPGRKLISQENPYSGLRSMKLNEDYGTEFRQSFSEIPGFDRLRQVEITLKIFNPKANDGVLWVMETNGEDGKSLKWDAANFPATRKNGKALLFD